MVFTESLLWGTVLLFVIAEVIHIQLFSCHFYCVSSEVHTGEWVEKGAEGIGMQAGAGLRRCSLRVLCDIIDAFVSTPAEHQLAHLGLLLKSSLLCSAAERQLCFACGLAPASQETGCCGWK